MVKQRRAQLIEWQKCQPYKEARDGRDGKKSSDALDSSKRKLRIYIPRYGLWPHTAKHDVDNKICKIFRVIMYGET